MLNKYFFGAGLLLALQACNQAPQHPTVTVHKEQVVCNQYIGNGVEWDAYPHADSKSAEWGDLMNNPAKWDTLYARLDRMQPQFIRMMDQANWRYYMGLNRHKKAVLNFNTPEIKTLFKLLDYCQSRNITVVMGEWGTPHHMHDIENKKDKLKAADDPRWSKMIAQYLDFLINKKGYSCIKYYNLVNEPNGDWASTLGDFDLWKRGVKQLHKELKAKGLDDKIQISGPGTVPQYSYPKYKSQYEGKDWVKMSVDSLNDELGAYEIHAYMPTMIVREGKAAKDVFWKEAIAQTHKTGKPFLIGELGLKDNFGPFHEKNIARAKKDAFTSPEDSQMAIYDYQYGVDMADAVVQFMNAGCAGTIAWALDDAMHTMGDKGDKTKLKRWGFWNILGTEIENSPKDEQIRPWFYPWSWACKYFPAHTEILKVDVPAIKGLRITAGTKEDKYSVMAVNNSEEIQTVTVQIDGLKSSPQLKKLTYTREQATAEKAKISTEQVSVSAQGGLSVTLPAKSVVVMTNMNK
ncbi:cellulase family glycosylhydrolase [Persicobacter psychrovividus]|uniref:Glycoside hydrolase family 5 domain-containing protein n=1 Tax=Persicobacter psychrovividus TaxID=387638 RepID=A0ABN6LGC6_9BACT|nr:hypothetical protein PEPS_44440 [Persicobacter psychrovividus]